jgi:peptidoglycan/xylan/chitin deacetylase (PgdA/CDA1 family)
VRTGRALLATVLTATMAVAGCGTAGPAPAPGLTASGASASPVPEATGFPAALAGKDIERLPTSEKVVALTFDAGANADAVPSILATLAREHITATFFLTGDFVTKYPGPAKQIAVAGHRIGNHSATHPAFAGLALALVRHEVEDGAQSIRRVTGTDPRPLFRFPFGSKDARAMTEVNSLGYVAVRWTVDSLGWQGTMNGTRGPGFTAARVLAAATPGEIVLMHVGSHPTDHSMLDAEALPAVIAGLRQKGYGFTTLRTLLG